MHRALWSSRWTGSLLHLVLPSQIPVMGWLVCVCVFVRACDVLLVSLEKICLYEFLNPKSLNHSHHASGVERVQWVQSIMWLFRVSLFNSKWVWNVFVFISLPIKSHSEQLAFLPLETKCHFSLHCQTSNAAFVSLPAATDSGPENGLEDEIIIWWSTMVHKALPPFNSEHQANKNSKRAASKMHKTAFNKVSL